MKPTVATGLSLVAVLAAGVLAAAANFRVLAGPDEAASASTIGTAVPVGDQGDGPQTFTVGAAGALTLDTAGGLHLVRLAPSPGWRAERRAAPAGTVVVAFRSPDGRLVVVTAAPGPDGIRVVAHDETTSLARTAGDDDDNEGADDD
jgi:hypothetical protein